MTEGCEKGKLWEEWFEYFKKVKKDIQENAENILQLEERPKVFILRKNRHIINTENIYFWRYIAIDKSDDFFLTDDFKSNNIDIDKLYKLFITDIFDKSFVAPKYEITDLMLFASIPKYFENISATKEGTYIKFISDVVVSPDFKHVCNENKAKKFKTFISNKLNKYNLSEEDYKSAIKYFEREALLKEYKEGMSIMFPIAVGAYYIMAIFLSFKNVSSVSKFVISEDEKCTFWSVGCHEDTKQKLLQLHLYLNQLPMMMLTKLYSLFPKHLPTITAEELLRTGLSLTLCVPEESIEISGKETSSKESENPNIIEIELPAKKIIIPYHGDNKFKTITTAQVRDIANKVYELHQNIEKLGEEKGAAGIAAAVAHNLRNTLRGFSDSLNSIASEYPGIYIQGRAVENRINWLDLVSRDVDLTKTVTKNLIEILVRAFDAAWGLILLGGEIVNKVDLVNKFKQDDIIVYPVLKIVTNSSQYNLVTISFSNCKRKAPASLIHSGKWGTNYLIPAFDEILYVPYQPLIKCRFESSKFSSTNNEGNEIIINEQFYIYIPEAAVGGIEGSIEEIFFNALKYGKEEKPVCIFCNLKEEGVIEISTPLSHEHKINKRGGGLIGNEVLYKRLRWEYSAKPEGDEFVNRIIYRSEVVK